MVGVVVNVNIGKPSSSVQLDPNGKQMREEIQTNPGRLLPEFLAEKKCFGKIIQVFPVSDNFDQFIHSTPFKNRPFE